jgi:hypothetical protein
VGIVKVVHGLDVLAKLPDQLLKALPVVAVAVSVTTEPPRKLPAGHPGVLAGEADTLEPPVPSMRVRG